MKRIKLLICCVFVWITLFSFNQEIHAVDSVDVTEFETENVDNQKVFKTLKNGVVIYESYFKDDGNLYMIIDGKETLALTVEDAPIDVATQIPTIISSILRAPSDFVFSSSSHPKKVKITEEVIDLGKEAILHTLLAFMQNQLDPIGISKKFYNATEEALYTVIEMALKSYGDYETSITQKNYKHHSCSWLTYVEFVYAEGPTIGSYTWSDNPSLEIATTMCKMASLTYPF